MNSTSDSEPRPSLRWNSRVLARRDALALDAGLHAPDLRARPRRRTGAPRRPRPAGRGSARPSAGSPATGRARAMRLALPRLRPAVEVGGVAVEAAGQRRPGGPRAAGRRRCRRCAAPASAPPTKRQQRRPPAAVASLVVVGRRRRRRRTARRGRWRSDSSPPPKRPRATTANGTCGLERRRAPPRRMASASAVEVGAHRRPRRRRRARRGPRSPAGGGRCQRRSACWRSSTSSRQRAPRVGRVDQLGAVAGSAAGRRRPGARSGRGWRPGPRPAAGWCRAAGTGGGPPRGRRGRRAASSMARCVAGRQLAQAEQAEVGSGDVDSQSSTSGRSCCISRDERVRPRVSSRTAARVRSASANPNAGQRARRPPRATARPAPGERVEQRPEVEALVDRAAPTVALAGEVAVERLGGPGLGRAPVAEHPGDAAAAVAVGGQGVHLLLVLELEAVLDPAQEAVGVGQAVGVVRVDVAGRRPARRARRAWWASAARGRRRPCTSCSSCTANSMSRMPPGPRLTSRSARPRRATSASARAFSARSERRSSALNAPAPERARRGRRPRPARRSASPATGRALSSAWNSHGSAHRSQYAS